MPEKLYHSKFKSAKGKRAFEDWYHSILERSDSNYSLKQVGTRYGSTRVAVCGREDAVPLVFLHGWSGNGMLWELNNLLHTVSDKYKIHLVDVIGQPNNSSNTTPAIKGNGYGHWLTDLMDGLNLATANFIGMSLGGFLIVKLAGVAAHRIDKAILMGPAGFTGIRLDPGLLLSFGRPFINSSDTNVASFLKYTILGSGHKLNEEYFNLLNKMFQVSFKHFKPGAQIPYVFPDQEIELLNAPVLLLCGENDALFSSNKTVNRAKALLPNLRHAELLPELGHAIGNYSLVIEHIKKFIQEPNK